MGVYFHFIQKIFKISSFETAKNLYNFGAFEDPFKKYFKYPYLKSQKKNTLSGKYGRAHLQYLKIHRNILQNIVFLVPLFSST